MTAQPIAPVIPSRGRLAARAGGRAGPVRQLPLAATPEIPSLPDEVVYGFGRMDVSGRVGDRASVSVLGWRPGDPLTLTAAAGVIIVRRDPAGLIIMPVKPYVAIPAVLEAALVLLERMGLSPADLAAAPRDRKTVPTFAEYVPVVSATVSPGTRRAYGSYWNRVVEHWGTRRLDEPAPSEIQQLMIWVKTHVVARRNARGGRSAEEHLVAALRCLYRQAERDGLIAEAHNPARKVDKPRRLPSTRRAVADTRLAEINQVAATTGNDPELDTVLLRLHTETACRRGGALALRPADLDPDQCLILLREKGETTRWQPVSPTLMARLVRHGQERHAPQDGQLFRYASGQPITSRRYDHLWTRIGRLLPWVRTQQISMHWIRHTTLTWVSRARSCIRCNIRHFA